MKRFTGDESPTTSLSPSNSGNFSPLKQRGSQPRIGRNVQSGQARSENAIAEREAREKDALSPSVSPKEERGALFGVTLRSPEPSSPSDSDDRKELRKNTFGKPREPNIIHRRESPSSSRDRLDRDVSTPTRERVRVGVGEDGTPSSPEIGLRTRFISHDRDSPTLASSRGTNESRERLNVSERIDPRDRDRDVAKSSDGASSAGSHSSRESGNSFQPVPIIQHTTSGSLPGNKTNAPVSHSTSRSKLPSHRISGSEISSEQSTSPHGLAGSGSKDTLAEPIRSPSRSGEGLGRELSSGNKSATLIEIGGGPKKPASNLQFEIIGGGQGTKRLGLATFGDMTLAAACKKKFVDLENRYIANRLNYPLNPNMLVKDVKDPCIVIIDGFPPEPSSATKNLAINWFQFLSHVKEFTKEEAKQYGIAFAVNELFPSDLSTLEEDDFEAKLGIHNRSHITLILQTCRQSVSSFV